MGKGDMVCARWFVDYERCAGQLRSIVRGGAFRERGDRVESCEHGSYPF